MALEGQDVGGMSRKSTWKDFKGRIQQLAKDVVTDLGGWVTFRPSGERKALLKLDLADSLVRTSLHRVGTVQSAGSGADVTTCKFRKSLLLLLHLMQVFEQVG